MIPNKQVGGNIVNGHGKPRKVVNFDFKCMLLSVYFRDW